MHINSSIFEGNAKNIYLTCSTASAIACLLKGFVIFNNTFKTGSAYALMLNLPQKVRICLFVSQVFFHLKNNDFKHTHTYILCLEPRFYKKTLHTHTHTHTRVYTHISEPSLSKNSQTHTHTHTHTQTYTHTHTRFFEPSFFSINTHIYIYAHTHDLQLSPTFLNPVFS